MGHGDCPDGGPVAAFLDMEGELNGLFDLCWLLRGVKGASVLPRDLARSAVTALLSARLSALVQSAAAVPWFAPASVRAFAARVLATVPVGGFYVQGMSATGGRKETRGTLVGQRGVAHQKARHDY